MYCIVYRAFLMLSEIGHNTIIVFYSCLYYALYCSTRLFLMLRNKLITTELYLVASQNANELATCAFWCVGFDHDYITLQWRQNGSMASQITSLTIVYSAVHSGADQRKNQSSASLALGGEFPAQMASNAENVSIWWRHHDTTEMRSVLLVIWDAMTLTVSL